MHGARGEPTIKFEMVVGARLVLSSLAHAPWFVRALAIPSGPKES